MIFRGRGIAGPTRIHGDDVITVPQLLGKRRPESSAEPVGVVEQRQRTLATPILERDLDTGFGQGDPPANHIVRHPHRTFLSLPRLTHKERTIRTVPPPESGIACGKRYVRPMATGNGTGALKLRDRIVANLDRFERRIQTDLQRIPAAVTILIVEDTLHPEPCFIITRRSSHLRQHPGQWALPGGRMETGEEADAAAIRETEEELGIRLKPEDLLGYLDDYPTRSGFLITPVVAWADPDLVIRPDPGEVAEVHHIPLAVLDRPEVPRLRQIEESDRPVISVPIPMLETNVHAPTAAILYQLREVALRGGDTRVDHYEQPVFAWR